MPGSDVHDDETDDFPASDFNVMASSPEKFLLNDIDGDCVSQLTELKDEPFIEGKQNSYADFLRQFSEGPLLSTTSSDVTPSDAEIYDIEGIEGVKEGNENDKQDERERFENLEQSESSHSEIKLAIKSKLSREDENELLLAFLKELKQPEPDYQFIFKQWREYECIRKQFSWNGTDLFGLYDLRHQLLLVFIGAQNGLLDKYMHEKNESMGIGYQKGHFLNKEKLQEYIDLTPEAEKCNAICYLILNNGFGFEFLKAMQRELCDLYIRNGRSSEYHYENILKILKNKVSDRVVLEILDPILNNKNFNNEFDVKTDFGSHYKGIYRRFYRLVSMAEAQKGTMNNMLEKKHKVTFQASQPRKQIVRFFPKDEKVSKFTIEFLSFKP